MAYRRKVTCLRLCRALIAANSAERRKRLKGSLFIRSRAVRRTNDLIAILHAAGDGREWARSKVDTVCSDLRKQAADSRLSADVRLKAIERLMALDGLLGLDQLGSDPMDDWIRTQIEPKFAASSAQVESAPTPYAGNAADFSDVLKKLEGRKDGIAD